MRYREIKQVPFKNVFGETKNLYIERKEKITSAVGEVDIIEGMELDEISNKIYGANSEIIAYKLRDQNVKKLLINDYDISKIKKITIGDSV